MRERHLIPEQIRGIIQRAADERKQRYIGHPGSRPLNPENESIGILGEFAFGQEFNLATDLAKKEDGDGRIDFVLPMFMTVDVKTAAKPTFLIHEVGKPMAHILVLARYNEASKDATLLGWEWAKNLRQTTPRKFPPHEIINYAIPREELRSIDELKEMCLTVQFKDETNHLPLIGVKDENQSNRAEELQQSQGDSDRPPDSDGGCPDWS